MASYNDISPVFIAKLFEERLRAEIQSELQKVADEIVTKAAKEVASKFQASVESWRTADRFGDDLRITLVDKRTNGIT